MAGAADVVGLDAGRDVLVAHAAAVREPLRDLLGQGLRRFVSGLREVRVGQGIELVEVRGLGLLVPKCRLHRAAP